ncbi:MAG TPA: hypothetical protein PKK23_01170 [Nitrospirales bacterium]|nr:hypothetical protein [Nitrospiraceae bacterium]HNP27622.1 hypothetical protein [Nitrospirales bacterium]
MLTKEISTLSSLGLTFICFSAWIVLSPLDNWKAEAAIKAEEVLTAGDPKPKNRPIMKRFLDLQNPQGWEKRLLGETFSQYHFQKSRFQSQNNPLLHLKSPGKLPGIELGVEMHSFQAFQSVIPSESLLPRGLDLKPEQPLLLPPSITTPDYNGGFLRFTW